MLKKLFCGDCRHNHFDEKRTCDAFPSGIPEEIRRGKVYHNDPYPGDHGIQFEKMTEEQIKTRLEK